MGTNKGRMGRCLKGVLIIFLSMSTVMPNLISMLPAQASVAQDDAVEFAISEIKRLDILWTPLFYVSTESVYRFAAPIAMSGAGYILLQSPKMVVDLVSGGLSGGPLAGLVKLVDGIQLDFILYIIEACVKTPKHVCRGLVKDTIDEGWAEYKRAYEIVRDYKRTGSLTREQALEFLRCRYGPDKLALAKTLRERISTADYSINRTAAEEATKDIMSRFSTSYQDKLGIDDKLPLVASAMFIKEIEEILRSKKAGLPAYVPYQRFSSEIEEIFRRIIDERERFEGIKAKPVSRPRPTTGPKPAGSGVAPIAMKSDFFTIRADATPPSVGPFRIGMNRKEIEAIAALYGAKVKVIQMWGEGMSTWPELEVIDSKGKTILRCLATKRQNVDDQTVPLWAKVIRISVVNERFSTPEGLHNGLEITRDIPSFLAGAVYVIFEDSTAGIKLEAHRNLTLKCEPNLWQIKPESIYYDLVKRYPNNVIPVYMLPAGMKIESIEVW